MLFGNPKPVYMISTSGPSGTSFSHWRKNFSGLGKDGKVADAFDNLAQNISKAIRGEKPDSYSISQPIPIQNVILIVGLGYVAYKIIGLAVKK